MNKKLENRLIFDYIQGCFWIILSVSFTIAGVIQTIVSVESLIGIVGIFFGLVLAIMALGGLTLFGVILFLYGYEMVMKSNKLFNAIEMRKKADKMNEEWEVIPDVFKEKE